jgi:hypothetical protein
MDGSKKRRLLFSLLLGTLIMVCLNLFTYWGAQVDLSIPSGVAFLIYAALWGPLEALFHDRRAPILFVAAVGLFDVLVISSIVYLFLLWWEGGNEVN